MSGLIKIKPVIKKISFHPKGKINIELEDGRIVIAPLRYFPRIQRLNDMQRQRWYILDGEMFSFDDCNEVFHIEQILGKENIYKYSFNKK